MQSVPPDFFHFTMQGLGIFTAISAVGLKVIVLLRKIDRGFNLWNWQHLVMWTKFEKENPVPPYPKLSWDDEARAEAHWLGRMAKRDSEPPPR
jgi:hypothetical protein